MKTVFITSFHPLISRNILATGVLAAIAPERRVVIFVPKAKAAYFTENFGRPGIIIEGIDTRLGARDLLFRRLAIDALPTRVLYLKKRLQLYDDKNVFKFLLSIAPTALFGRSPMARRGLRWVDERSLCRRMFAPYVRTYHPDLVFSTDVQNEFDVQLLQEAKCSGLATMAMVRSWDNLTSKGIIRALPDELIVHNDLIKAEAIRYDDVPPERISVIGIPHYDSYRDPPGESRSAFFARFGLNPAKKLVLWAPIGDRYIRNNETDALALGAASALDVNILVRLPPQDTVNFGNFSSQRARVAFDRTGTPAGGGGVKANELNREDNERLITSLAYCDAVVTGHSTIMIDAAIFDRPVVNICFDAEPRNYWDSFARYFEREYLKLIVASGGVRLARSPQELVADLERYLENPRLDREGRARIVREQVWQFDGQATRRLADVLLSRLK